MADLKDREQRVLNFITEQIKINGYPPTVRDIGAALGIKSTSTVQKSMTILEEEGFIRKQAGKRRAFEVVAGGAEKPQAPAQDRADVVDVPLVGRVAAGMPILAEQNIEGSFPMPAQFIGKGTNFMLTVHGDSMIEAGIMDGDYILVQEQKTANNGDIVVAMINGEFESESTVKTFYKENGHIRLQPQNSSMDPIIVDDCEIVGLVKGVFRYLS
ncbi:MAG: transcriptional repressor LexA [Clostridia bacterium]|nr:transcriptional repressor LexA [Bacillota bacterium]MBR6236124.1 transcriptional repressor LexA [Bacillota bacterium]MCR5009746.1 transcriptional repressor LexA [Clostridia bacterium]